MADNRKILVMVLHGYSFGSSHEEAKDQNRRIVDAALNSFMRNPGYAYIALPGSAVEGCVQTTADFQRQLLLEGGVPSDRILERSGELLEFQIPVESREEIALLLKMLESKSLTPSQVSFHVICLAFHIWRLQLYYRAVGITPDIMTSVIDGGITGRRYWYEICANLLSRISCTGRDPVTWLIIMLRRGFSGRGLKPLR